MDQNDSFGTARGNHIILLVYAFSYHYIYICKIVYCPVELPGQLPVPDLHNCPASARSQSLHLIPMPHVFVSVVIHGAQITVLQTVSQQTLALAQKPSRVCPGGQGKGLMS